MSINPDNITTIRVDQLAEATLNLTNEFPHSEDATLRKATIQSLVDLVATAVGSGSGVGFLPISVTDGQQLPSVPADPSFFLCGAGTYLNVNGYPNVVCTGDLNAVMSVSDHWQVAVEIPITADLQSIGISQSVNDGVLDKAPSENAVYDFISQWLPKASLGYFDYADLATQTTPITVNPDTETLLTNDTLGDDTNTSQPPYGVTAIWDADSDEFNFQQLSVGDTVDIRIHLKTTTTTANQKYHIDMKFAFDAPSEFENRVFSQYVKTAGEDEQTFITTFYIGSEDVKNYPARLYITSDDDATVKVVGWFCRVFRKSVNIVDIITDEAPIDGLTYGRKDAEWVEISDSGTPTLQEVLDFNNDLFEGNNFQGTNAGAGQTGENVNAFGSNSAISNNKDNVNAFGFQSAYENSGDNVNAFGFNAGASNTFKNINAFGFEARADADNQTIFSKWISGVTKYLGRLSFNNITADRKWELPDASGTIALTSEIPPSITIDATPTDGSSNAVSSNGVFDALVLKQDALTETNFGSFINGLTAKNTLVDADEVVSDDSADSNKAKKTSWLNVWTNYLKPKADALYATISNLALKQDFATATTGAVISFAVPQIYNTVASPSSSNFTDDLTGARVGVVQKIYSNKATEPTYPAGWVKLSGTYTNSVTNIIYCEWCEGSRVEYWIVEA